MTELTEGDLPVIFPDTPHASHAAPFYKRKSFWGIAAGFSGIFLLNFFVFSNSACFGFNKIDWGFMLEAAWRMWCGQKIYQDFVFHVGPVHPLMHLLFFKLFGLGKNAVIMHLTIINTLATALTFAAAWRRLPVFFALLCTFFTLMGFYWLYPHPYYDYTGHFFGLCGILALALTLPPNSARSVTIAGFVCGIMAVLTCLTKINIGAAYSGVFGLTLLVSRRPLRGLAAFAAGIFAAAGMMALTFSFPAFWANISEFNPIVSQRLMRFIVLPVFFKNFFWLPFVLLYLATMGRRLVYLPQLVLCLGLGAIAIFTINTGSYRGTDYLMMSGMYMVLTYQILFSIFRESVSRSKKTIIAIFIGLLTASVIYQQVKHLPVVYSRVRTGLDTSPQADRYELKNGPFRGWVFKNDMGPMVDSMIETVQKIPPSENLLILSYMQFIYVFSKKESFKNIPAQWYVGTDPPPGKRAEVTRYILENKPDWILASREGTEFPINEIIDYLGIPLSLFLEYDDVQSWGPHGLLKRRA